MTMTESPPLVSIATSSVDETRGVAASLGQFVRSGDLIVLSGDLGAGKTAFTQGLGVALGVEAAITSPTFTLANRYSGDLTVNHLDVYRLEHIDEVDDLGLHELVDDVSVTIVEWGDAIAGALPCGFLEVRLLFGVEPDDRHAEFRIFGSEWTERTTDLLKLSTRPTGTLPC